MGGLLASVSLPFQFEVPMAVFEKSDTTDPVKVRRIAGIISTERVDQQGDVVLQNGLDFAHFLSDGWFNDNHSKATDGVLGYPENVAYFSKGDILPDGNVAESNLHWVEGYLLETEKANRIWELGRALQGTGRRLGFSVEGAIQKRMGPGKKTIAKASVRNVAITNCPVNTDSRLEVLARSLTAFENADEVEFAKALEIVAEASATRALQKALTAGTPTGINPPEGPVTGEGAAQILSPQSLEQDEKDVQKRKKKSKKSLTKSEAIAWVRTRLPGVDEERAGFIVQLAEAFGLRPEAKELS